MTESGTYALKDAFLRELSEVKSNGVPPWFDVLRRRNAAAFAELDFPTQRTEEWRFTNIRPLLSTPFESIQQAGDARAVEPYIFGEPAWSELVFVDGRYCADLSHVAHKGIVATTLYDALKRGDATLESRYGKLLDNKPSVFNALNTALATDGAFVSVPKGMTLDGVVHLVFLTTHHDVAVATHPRTLVVAGESARFTLLETYASAPGTAASFCNAAVEIYAEPNAHVARYKCIQEGEHAYNLSSTRVHLDRDSVFDSYVFAMSGKIVRDDLAVTLDGEGAACNLYGLFMTSGNQLVDNATAIEHVKPHCSSWIGYKGILDDASHGVFSGKIFVHREAQKTDSKQLNQNLLLSDKATINTKPLLEIFADDVKCTHGATIGQHPDEIIFYFRSRGMDEPTARGMLTYGFADEVVERVQIPQLRARMSQYVFDRYSPK